MDVYLDTEFTNFIDTELISLGMFVPPSAEFYVEVPFNESACSAFVREAVIPQLRQVEDAFICKPMLGQAIMNWLNEMRPESEKIRICFDYETDWALFADALDGQIPEWVVHENVARDVNKLLKMQFYRRHVLSEHHALADARALAYSYRPRNWDLLSDSGVDDAQFDEMRKRGRK